MLKIKSMFANILQTADIQINGKVTSVGYSNTQQQFYPRVLHHSSVGLGESTWEKWWDCNQLDEFFLPHFRCAARQQN